MKKALFALLLAGFAPLAAGIVYALGTSSILVLLPCPVLGGMIAGPFLAGDGRGFIAAGLFGAARPVCAVVTVSAVDHGRVVYPVSCTVFDV